LYIHYHNQLTLIRVHVFIILSIVEAAVVVKVW